MNDLPTDRAMKCICGLAALAALALTSCRSAPPGTELTASPELLLRAILDRAVQGDYEGVRPFVYPAPALPHGLTTQDGVVGLMQHDRGPGYTGDFSYSHEALQLIVERHVHRFAPLQDESSDWLSLTSQGGLVDDELRRATGGDPSCFWLFDHQNCHILLVEIDGAFRLVFWEGMNHLLTEDGG